MKKHLIALAGIALSCGLLAICGCWEGNVVEVLIVLVAIAAFCNACAFYARIVVLAVRHAKKLSRLVELTGKQEGQVRL